MSESLHEQYCLIRNRRARYIMAALFLWFLLSAIGELGKSTFAHEPPNPFGFFLPSLPWVSTLVWLAISLWMIFATVSTAIPLLRECESRYERIAYGALGAFFVTAFLHGLAGNGVVAQIVRNVQLLVLAVGFLASWAIVLMNPRSGVRIDSSPNGGLFGCLLVYVVMVLIATLGSALAALTAIQSLSSLARFAGANAFAKELSSALLWPFSPFLTTAGVALGFFTVTLYRTRAALWVWIGPLVFVAIAFLSFRPASVFQNYWQSALSHFFGSCSGDCNDRVFIAPFLASAAFAGGALLRMKMGDTRSRERIPPNPQSQTPAP